MRQAGMVLCWITASLLGIVGCHSHQPNLKPEEGPEALNCPADADKRYSTPSQYPPESLESDPLKALNRLNNANTPKAPKPGMMGPGMGGGSAGGF
jgi:hypothetical protein